MADMQSWQSMLRKEHYEKVIENVTEIPRPPYFPPLAMCSDPGTLGIRWENWIDRFDNFIDALEIEKEVVKRAMLFYYVGDEVCKIFATLPMTGGEKDYELAKTRLTEYFVPMQDNVYETHLFRKLVQEKGEGILQYETRLREYANRCHFDDINKQIKSRLILTCNMPRLRRRAQKEPSLSLHDILAIGRSIELEDYRAKKQAEEAARKSVTSIHSRHSSKGTIVFDESKSKCFGKLFKSCAGKNQAQDSDEESEPPEEEPEEEIKVVFLEMTPKMRQMRALKKSKSMPEQNHPDSETKDDMPLIEPKEKKTPVSQEKVLMYRHRRSVDVLMTGSVSPKKERSLNTVGSPQKERTPKKKGRDRSKSPAKPKKEREKHILEELEGAVPDGEEVGEDGKKPVKKTREEVKSPKKKRQGSKSPSPTRQRKEPSSPVKPVPDEGKALADRENIQPAEQMNIQNTVDQKVEETSRVKAEAREEPKSPTKKKARSPSPSKERRASSPKKKRDEAKEGPKSPAKAKEGKDDDAKKEKTCDDAKKEKSKKRKKSKDKASEDKKGILKKEPIEITVTTPDGTGDVPNVDTGVCGKETKQEKHEKGKVTFSEGTKEPVVGKYNPDMDTGTDENKNVAEGGSDSKEADGLEQSKGSGSPKKRRKDERQRRPSRDLM